MTGDSKELVRLTAERRLRARGYLPVAEVVEVLGLHPNTVYNWISRGEVSGVKLGKARYVLRASVVEKIGKEAALAFGLVAEAASEEVEVET